MRWSVFQSRPKTITEALKVALELYAFKESERSKMRKSVRGVSNEVSGGELCEERSHRVTDSSVNDSIEKSLAVLLKKMELFEASQKLVPIAKV
jgi:hypothetical protein